MSKKTSSSTGIGIFGLMFCIFLVFKLADIGIVSTWSWWYVTAPLWGPLALGLAIFILYVIIKIIFMSI